MDVCTSSVGGGLNADRAEYRPPKMAVCGRNADSVSELRWGLWTKPSGQRIRVWLITTSDHFGPHRTASNYIGPCLQTRDHNFISEAKMRWNYFQANKLPGTQLAHYKLCRHKSRESLPNRYSVLKLAHVCACVTGLQHSALYRYGRFAKSSIRPRSSVAYMSPTVSKTV